jgi:cyclohexanecarboxylate-CoA ligase
MSSTITIDGADYTKRDGRSTTILDDFLASVAEHPDKTALVSYFVGKAEPVSLTYREMAQLIDRLALKLLELGIGPKEVVSYQFPNRWEFAVAHLATIRIGAISNAIMPIYGKREIRFMLERTDSRVCMGLACAGNARPGDVLNEIKTELPTLEHVLVIDDEVAGGSLKEQLAEIVVDDEARARLDALKPHPDDIEAILFSSGTTGEPKGILHSFNSTFRATSNCFPIMNMSADDVVLMFSPLGHATGFDYGLVMPLICGCKFVYQDSWDPEEMLRIVERERVTWTMGSAAFARDACDAAERLTYDLSSFRCFVCGGAPIPPKLIGRTSRLLHAQLIPCWGMTEIGIATLGRLTDNEERRASSDGAPVPGVELRIVDDEDRPVPAGTPGHIHVRATGQHVGYHMNEKLYQASFHEGGWFGTGDLGKLDKDGYIRICGRSKDLVIRGGENIPIIEVENLLLNLPEIAEICIVGVPDERLGERCHAVVLPKREDAVITLETLTSHLQKAEVTKQYWPEFLTITSDFPRTATGKIQRFAVRQFILQQGQG